tara:strand:- start:1594 stop:1902 length:309 start_codon:yes stop_codon:yes gene_type:complete
MDWQTITIAGFIALVVVLLLFFSVKEPSLVRTPVQAQEQSLSTGNHHAPEITTRVQKELKGIKHRIEDIEFNQRKLSDRIAALQLARGIESEQVKYLTQNAI